MSGASATTVSKGRDREAGEGTGEAVGPKECVKNRPCRSGDRSKENVNGGASSDGEKVFALEFVTPDPFVFRDGELQLR